MRIKKLPAFAHSDLEITGKAAHKYAFAYLNLNFKLKGMGNPMKTMKLPIEQVIPGMVVVDDVYTFNNQLIITKGTKLTDRVITHLNFYAIPHVIIALPEEESEPEAPSFIQEPYSEKVKGSPEFKKFSDSFLSASEHFEGQLNTLLSNNSKQVDTDVLLSEVDSILQHSRNGLHLFDMLHCMRDADDYIYMHCINVALICNILGKWLKFSKKDRETLTLCGLLHDIGKLEIPAAILKKPSKLTNNEYEIIKQHTVKGYEILKQKDLNIHVQLSAMMHHERCDGSGYPMGLKDVQINKMAKIVMIADVYDAMTSARAYRGPVCPFEVLAIFETEGMSKFDPRFMMVFLDFIKETYLGNTVRLNDKSLGKIVMMNRNRITKPVIQRAGDFIDLTQDENLFIESIL